MIRVYRWVISPAKQALFGSLGRCRFSPSCSQYALESVCTHGAVRGSWLALKRLVRCHPWGSCGYDPVPPKEKKSHSCHEAGCDAPVRDARAL